MMWSRRQLQQQSSSRAAAASRKITLQQCTRYGSSSRNRKAFNAAATPTADNDEHAAANALLAAATAPVRDAFPLAVRVATVAGGYRGLVATRALREGDVALAVPLANALVVPGEKHEPGADATDAAAALIENWQAAHGIELPAVLSKFLVAVEAAEWDVRLAAWLLWLLRRGEQGLGDDTVAAASGDPCLWDLYASMLPAPEDCSSFFDFTDDETEAWLPYAKWRDRHQNLAASRDKATEAVFGALAGADTASSAAAAGAAWAYSLVRSRTFGRRLTAGSDAVSNLMVPGADLVNHSPWPNAKFHFSRPARLFTVTATRAIEAGEEVTISYGRDRPNASLFANYGFVCAGNPNDHLTLPPRAGAPLARCVAPRTAILLHGDGKPPAVTAWHMHATPDEIVAADPSLRESPGFWRRRSALTALGLLPPADDAGESSSSGSGSSHPEIDSAPDAASLFATLSVYRQLQRLVARAEARIAEEQARGWGCAARRAAAAAAAREEALLLAECVDACESELAALGVTFE